MDIENDLFTILEVQPEITIKNVDSFRMNTKSLLERTTPFLILDLRNVTYMNSSGLGIIADTAMKAKKDNKELILLGVRDPLLEIFEIVKFDTFIKWFSNLDEAKMYCLESIEDQN